MQKPSISPLDFMLAGNSTFTVKSGRTGRHLTYKVKESQKEKGVYFVSVLIGQNNDKDYAYIGMISKRIFGWHFYTTKGTKLRKDSVQVISFIYILEGYKKGDVVENVEFFHMNKCCRCGRTLTTPTSIVNGAGDVCYKLMNKK